MIYDIIKFNEYSKLPQCLIFLDIDGVLNNCNGLEIHRSKIERLKKIINETKASIILSSSWRLFDDWLFKLIIELNKYGIEISGKTKDLSKEYSVLNCRSEEIKDFLIDYENIPFVILDDDKELLKEFSNNLILTQSKIGLTDEDVIKAIQILKVK